MPRTTLEASWVVVITTPVVNCMRISHWTPGQCDGWRGQPTRSVRRGNDGDCTGEVGWDQAVKALHDVLGAWNLSYRK